MYDVQEGYLEVMMPLMGATLQHPSRRAEQRAGLTRQAQQRKTIISHQKNREEQEAIFKVQNSLFLNSGGLPWSLSSRAWHKGPESSRVYKQACNATASKQADI